jgi:uncharacterized membrane protein
VFFRGAETHSRSVLKAVSWRALGTSDTFAISWFMTGRAEIAGSIAAMEVVTKVAWYYLHERIWALVPWGDARPRHETTSLLLRVGGPGRLRLGFGGLGRRRLGRIG